MRKNYFDKKRRKLYNKLELKRIAYKYLVGKEEEKEGEIEKRESQVKIRAHKELKEIRNSSATRIRNRCIVTGRGRGVYNKLSRHNFRKMAENGEIRGVKLGTW